ncbi:MAG TPA: SAM-dependent chlorinase/fluorinase [Cyclobacteriaceae bacterium]|nr:SAM-dependent chlorinase/fluorinase [Cyclobacteriaceae bacterium]
MAIVTLLTDSGEIDHYVAAIKARILRDNPATVVVDLTHRIATCDIAHAAFVLRSVFREFPPGTVHLAGVHATGNRDDHAIALQLEDHFFVGSDNGLFSLISDTPPQQVVVLTNDAVETFPERDVFAPAAARLAAGASLQELGEPLESLKRMVDRHVKATRKLISGNVIHVDSFGNLITNIPRTTFEAVRQDRPFTIQFGGEKFRRLHTRYNQAEEGECVLLFNSLGLLEIGIYKGNASELLGLTYDSMVNISFQE